MTQQAQSMPGRATGLSLFLMGGAAVFLSGVIFVLSGFGAAEFDNEGWIVPFWGRVALILAVVSRKERVSALSAVSKAWLVIGAIGLAMIIFGSTVRSL